MPEDKDDFSDLKPRRRPRKGKKSSWDYDKFEHRKKAAKKRMAKKYIDLADEDLYEDEY